MAGTVSRVHAAAGLGVLVACSSALTLWASPRHEAPASAPDDLVLSGNRSYTTAEIAAELADALPVVDRDGAERVGLLISAFYMDQGYAEVEVGPPRLDLSRHSVAFSIHEGARFQLGTITVGGDVPLAGVWPGAVFSRIRLMRGIDAIRRVYAERGHAYASITPRTSVDETNHTIAIAVDVSPGPIVTFERIDVVAHTPKGRAALRRALAVAPGDRYRESALLVTKRRALATGLFSDVALSTKHGSTGDRIVATVEAIE